MECLLFTDLLLICKTSKRMEKYKIIKPPMRVDRIIVQELKDKGIYLQKQNQKKHEKSNIMKSADVKPVIGKV